MSGRGARRADGVTRDMINTRRLEVLEQIKQLEEKLNKERRAKKRARSKSTRLRSKLLGAGSSLVASNMTVSTARSDRSFRPPASPMEFKSAAYYARVGRQGKTMARLLDSTQCGADVKEVGELSTSKRTHQFRPESVREELDADWDLRHPRYQTELTRYVDVVLRQNLAPFQSTAMRP